MDWEVYATVYIFDHADPFQEHSLTISIEHAQSARKSLLEDGYCMVDDAITTAFLSELRDWADHLLNTTEPLPYWKYQGSDIKIDGLRRASNADPDWLPEVYQGRPENPKDEIVDRLIEWPSQVLDALGLSDFHSDDSFTIISKPPKSVPLYWHQDWWHWDDPISGAPWPQQVFLSWYLSETDRTNGCLRVIPGSHLERTDLHDHLIPAHEGGGFTVDEENEWMFLDHPDAIDVPARPGQLFIGDARLLHGTYRNMSNQRRTVLLGWYYRGSYDVPSDWEAKVPRQILERPSDFPPRWNREPGAHLASANNSTA